MTSAEARFNKSLRPRKPEGSLGRTAQDVHLDSHTAPELRTQFVLVGLCIYSAQNSPEYQVPVLCRPRAGRARRDSRATCFPLAGLAEHFEDCSVLVVSEYRDMYRYNLLHKETGSSFIFFFFFLAVFTLKSKETVGNSWTVLKVILGHKYHNH